MNRKKFRARLAVAPLAALALLAALVVPNLATAESVAATEGGATLEIKMEGKKMGFFGPGTVHEGEELKVVDMTMPSMVIHGDADQFVPLADTGELQAKLIPQCVLKVYEGAPHGLCTTHKERVSADLLEFFKA